MEWSLNSDANVYNIKIITETNENITFSIQDEFEFIVKKLNFEASTKDDFIQEICEELNLKKYLKIEDLLSNFTKKYSIMINDVESPLYKGQDVFDDENDNHDIKFTSRIRFDLEKFNKDIILNLFFYLNYKDLVKLSLVCKEWYKLSHEELLWKNLTKEENPFIQELGYRKSFIESFKTDHVWDAAHCYELIKKNYKDEIKITNKGLTIDCDTHNPTAYKYILLTKPFSNPTTFAFKVENVTRPDYLRFYLCEKEKNDFLPGTILAHSFYGKYDLQSGVTYGLVFDKEKFKVFVDDILTEIIYDQQNNLYACICCVYETRVTIIKNWRPKIKTL